MDDPPALPDECLIPPLDGDGPLWLQIRRALSAAILGGDWRAGTRLPTEIRLTQHYATARMTVNKALQSLVAEGLVERRPRIGTIVTARAGERSVFELWDAADLARRMGGRYRYRLIECEILPPGSDAHAELAVTDPVKVLRATCLHMASDTPVQFEQRVVNLAAAPGLACSMLDTVSPGQWLLANIPWTEARHAVSARGATPAVATHLALAVGDPCLVVERRTWTGTMPVTLGRFWYPGGDAVLQGAIRPAR